MNENLKEKTHSNFHSYHYEDVNFKPASYIDEDDKTITLKLDAVDNLRNSQAELWAMSHVSVHLTYAQFETLRIFINKVEIPKPQPEIDDIIRNIEESEVNS